MRTLVFSTLSAACLFIGVPVAGAVLATPAASPYMVTQQGLDSN